jgi:DGQHR domain-containing protein
MKKITVRKKIPTRKKRVLTPEQIQARDQKAHEKAFILLFKKLGFRHINSDGTEIRFMGRAGELDGIFIYENIILITEFTIGKPNTAHLLKKKPLYDYIQKNVPDFLDYAADIYDLALNELYPLDSYVIKILYVSKQEPSAELIDTCPTLGFLHGSNAKYFQALVKTIEQSARIEFLKFLGLEYENVGEAAITNRTSPLTYQGFLLPDSNSSYPRDYKVVSFYADPEHLIAKSYVFRRDGWRDSAHLYQRVLITKKIRQMRRYLLQEGRVFVNNIIVTLPPETQLNEIGKNGKNLSKNDMGRVKAVEVQIPSGFDMVGLVDGQHRVFCYHEGSDPGEEQIRILRKRQNLMVTGIVFPAGTSEIERRSFEAKLFLEINDNQTGARSSLKQDIEVIIRPYSGIAIAKRIIQEMNKHGPYKGMLQTNFFDSPIKIKTSSIVSYGLRPLVKLDGSDSLFYAWNKSEKLKLREIKNTEKNDLLEEYISYCVQSINDFLLQAKLSLPGYAWDLESSNKSPVLSLTAINGLFSCLRKIIADGQPIIKGHHKNKLVNLAEINFGAFRSSQWQKLGAHIFENFYQE